MNQVVLLLIILSLLGCATPSQRFLESANELGFKTERLSSAQFQHQLYTTNLLNKEKILHVYLDGDGTPWERNRWIAKDPTARNPLILRLMAQDKSASILLGRPCYYGLNDHLKCTHKYWTSHRYSKEIVDSMVRVLNAWLIKHQFKQVVLIGYSGGGSLAVLMADKITAIEKVVTVSANLDVTAWSEYHGYSALKDSLNPADEVKLDSRIKQFHFAGVDDEVVPAFIIKAFAEMQNNTKYFEVDEQDHSCCWESEWKNILKMIK